MKTIKGVTIWTKDEILAEQADWDDSDSAKKIDFTTHEYWVTGDFLPVGFNELADMAAYLGFTE